MKPTKILGLKKNTQLSGSEQENLKNCSEALAGKENEKVSPTCQPPANYKGHLRRSRGSPFNTTECTKLSRDHQQLQETPHCSLS